MIRAACLAVICAATLCVGTLALMQPAPLLIWNATASTPIGLYFLRPARQFHVMDLVAIRPPEPIANYLADPGFLPKGALLLKHVLALPGQKSAAPATPSRSMAPLSAPRMTATIWPVRYHAGPAAARFKQANSS